MTAPTAPTPKSIHELPLLESGGSVARQGFVYQDHIAVGLLLELVEDHELTQVWCEAVDDITLIWVRVGGEEVEFVQVKSATFEQLWTVALLCREDGASGKCLVSKSLANDRCSEPTSFRIVTRWETVTELRVLRHRAGNPLRTEERLRALASGLAARLGDLKSEKGNDVRYWVDRTRWDVRGDQDAVISANLVRLNGIAHNLGAFLAPDQLQELYAQLLAFARSVAEAGPSELDKKKVTKARMMQVITTGLDHHALGSASRPGLEHKLREAGFSDTTIEAARDFRMKYRREVLTPRYFTAESREPFELEVQALLHGLKAELDGGIVNESPQQFLVRCVEALKGLHGEWGVTAPSLAMCLGAMYDITHRCLHRFNRAAA